MLWNTSLSTLTKLIKDKKMQKTIKPFTSKYSGPIGKAPESCWELSTKRANFAKDAACINNNRQSICPCTFIFLTLKKKKKDNPNTFLQVTNLIYSSAKNKESKTYLSNTDQTPKNIIPSNKVSLAIKLNNSSLILILRQRK